VAWLSLPKAVPLCYIRAMTFSRSRRAYTLLEVLVVLGIIALLAAILLPVFARVRENGRKTVCLSNMRQIMLAVSLYTQDSAGQFPSYSEPWSDAGGHSYHDATSWTVAVSPYLTTPQLLHCPSDELWAQRQAAIDTSRRPVSLTSYIANTYCLTQQRLTFPILGPIPSYPQRVFERDIVRPSTTVWMCDGARDAWKEAPYTQDSVGDPGAEQPASGDTLKDPTGAPEATCKNGFYGYVGCNNVYAPDDRHLGRANVAFADGHVKAMNNADWYFPNTPWLDPKRGG